MPTAPACGPNWPARDPEDDVTLQLESFESLVNRTFDRPDGLTVTFLERAVFFRLSAGHARFADLRARLRDACQRNVPVRVTVDHDELLDVEEPEA